MDRKIIDIKLKIAYKKSSGCFYSVQIENGCCYISGYHTGNLCLKIHTLI